jgi:hypothetical protein
MRRGDAIGAVNVCARYSEATVNEWYLLIRKREYHIKNIMKVLPWGGDQHATHRESHFGRDYPEASATKMAFM